MFQIVLHGAHGGNSPAHVHMHALKLRSSSFAQEKMESMSDCRLREELDFIEKHGSCALEKIRQVFYENK